MLEAPNDVQFPGIPIPNDWNANFRLQIYLSDFFTVRQSNIHDLMKHPTPALKTIQICTTEIKQKYADISTGLTM